METSESAYKDPDDQAPVGIMAPGGEIQNGYYSAPCIYQKQASIVSPIVTYDTRQETVSVCMIFYEQAIRKSTAGVNAPLQCQGCTNVSIYHSYRLHIYSNCLNNMYRYVSEHAKRSIQDYTQYTSSMVVNRGSQYRQGIWGLT